MPESAVIIEACAECQQDLEHCHGTAILHVDGAADCSDDPDCRLTAELHWFVISCAELDRCCDAAGAAPELAAAQAAAS
jgi:hypothetical protein